MPTKNKSIDKFKYCFDGDRYWMKLFGLEDSLEFYKPHTIKRVIFNDPATIVFWQDGTKTVVKCSDRDSYDKEKGLAMCFVKKMFGNSGKYYDVFKQWCEEKEVEDN